MEYEWADHVCCFGLGFDGFCLLGFERGRGFWVVELQVGESKLALESLYHLPS